jgi:formylglycine-generating enzyme required for sulfatase activity
MTSNWLPLQEAKEKYSLSERDMLLLISDGKIHARSVPYKNSKILILNEENLAKSFIREDIEQAAMRIVDGVPAHMAVEVIDQIDMKKLHDLAIEIAAATTMVRKRADQPSEAVSSFRDIEAPWCPELVAIPPGKFMMGEGQQHEVQFLSCFAIGRYLVTFEEYGCFAKAAGRGPPHDYFGAGSGRCPVIDVSWGNAQAYVQWLSRETGCLYRLPSEAEWEYACRAGTTTRHSWGDDDPTVAQANFGLNVGAPTEVGAYLPNLWGLYDMHGNVWEWIEDCWNGSYQGAPSDGSAWTSGDCSRRVMRGGSWLDGPEYLRSAYRGGVVADGGDLNFGFRVARTL